VSVAHKLDFATKFDRIIVMEDGRIVEFERPGELLSRASKFKALHSAQLQGME
jgi:ABC-type multidrug transport system fused ATPase/permease subunit